MMFGDHMSFILELNSIFACRNNLFFGGPRRRTLRRQLAPREQLVRLNAMTKGDDAHRSYGGNWVMTV